MTVKISHNRPMPPKILGRRLKYPVDRLSAIDDSLFIPCAAKSKIHKIASVVYRAAKRHGITVTMRRVEGGIEFWRIA